MMKGTCSIDGCERIHEARGYCRIHYRNFRFYGHPLGKAPRRSMQERFWSKVNKTESCWLWTAYINIGGYGTFTGDRQGILVHRWAYEDLIGPIPSGLVLDHLCRVRNCVNPDHLEPVTLAENIRRGTQGDFQKAKTHCPQGHEYTPENTNIKRGQRHCRECGRRDSRERQRRRRARERDEASPLYNAARPAFGNESRVG